MIWMALGRINIPPDTLYVYEPSYGLCCLIATALNYIIYLFLIRIYTVIIQCVIKRRVGPLLHV